MDTFSNGQDSVKTDVSYIGEFDKVASDLLPEYADINNRYTFKVFGPKELNHIEGWFWNDTPANVAKNTKLSLLLNSPQEFYWESIFYCKPILDPLQKWGGLNVSPEIALNNYSIYENEAKSLRDRMWSSNTYFHEVDKIFRKLDSKIVRPLHESLLVKYEENRIYRRQS